ncbi:FxLYD domain-containing protein [Kitasatospora sp. NPDC089509]|uniref:FxLYD domain-containing protein n=1 Tax=Kitasatospora sp. NPDC089509 TaxID=3364079 RepID=UPI00381D6F44
MDRTDLRPPARAVSGQRANRPISRHHRWAAGVLAAAALGSAVLAGCSSGKSASSSASSAAGEAQKLASAAASAASALASAAGGIAGGVGGVIASAEAEASSAISAASSAVAGIKGGLDAKGDVSAGAVTTGSDGKPEVRLTVTNHGQQSYRYVIQVNFTDAGGKLLDATAVTVDDVAPGRSSEVVANANRSLGGTVKAEVANAVRY